MDLKLKIKDKVLNLLTNGFTNECNYKRK